jgi:arabinofuranosyltransferase
LSPEVGEAVRTDAETDAPVEAVRTPRSWWPVLLTLVPAVMIGVGGWVHRWTDEDAFINFRIVSQIVSGHGPVFNAGERVEAFTSPLWLAILVVGRETLGLFMSLEWVSVLLGLAAAIAAFAIGGRAARFAHEQGAFVVPIGLVFAAAIPVMWDFASSGLEMGIVWLWLGSSWWILLRAARTDDPSASPWWAPVVIGLGPLVRPELGLMMVCLLVGWLVIARPRRIARDLSLALALPVAYEIFRMGYYASIVPSTALAKDSGGTYLSQGWGYLNDLLSTYWLWIPIALVVVTVVIRLHELHDRRVAIATWSMLAASAVSVAYLVVSGGDYMHGRLLLPAVFALALPASIALRPTTLAKLGVLAVGVVWSLVVVAAVRYPPPRLAFGVTDIADWRLVLGKKMFHPEHSGFLVTGDQVHTLYQQGKRGYMRVTDKMPRPGKDPHALVITLGSIGVPAYDAGRQVWVIDIGGLAEPLAARTSPIAGRPAGHRKQVDEAWYDARFGAAKGNAKVQAARRALACPKLATIISGIDEPLTPGRFLSNIWHAVPNTFVHVPRDPIKGEQELC